MDPSAFVPSAQMCHHKDRLCRDPLTAIRGLHGSTLYVPPINTPTDTIIGTDFLLPQSRVVCVGSVVSGAGDGPRGDSSFSVTRKRYFSLRPVEEFTESESGSKVSRMSFETETVMTQRASPNARSN